MGTVSALYRKTLRLSALTPADSRISPPAVFAIFRDQRKSSFNALPADLLEVTRYFIAQLIAQKQTAAMQSIARSGGTSLVGIPIFLGRVDRAMRSLIPFQTFSPDSSFIPSRTVSYRLGCTKEIAKLCGSQSHLALLKIPRPRSR